MGVEPTEDGQTRLPPVLKTGRITGSHSLPRTFNITARLISQEAEGISLAKVVRYCHEHYTSLARPRDLLPGNKICPLVPSGSKIALLPPKHPNTAEYP